MHIKCKHCMSIRKVYKIDGETNHTLKNEWWWFCDCDLLGDEQEVGYDCGKAVCRLWEKKENER